MKLLKWFDLNNAPIRYKLVIHFLLISILPSIGLAFLIGWTVNNIIDKQVNEHTLQMIDKVNNSLEFYVGNTQNMTYLISFDSKIKRFLNRTNESEAVDTNEEYEMGQFLQGFTTLHSEIAGILIVNRYGEYISNEMYARTSNELTRESWYRKAEENRGIFKIIGHPRERNLAYHVNYRDNELVTVVRAIVDPWTQEVKGVVLIDLKLRIIAEIAKDVRLGKTGYLMVIDSNGDYIYTPTYFYINDSQKEWFRENNSGTFSEKVNGETLQFIYRKSSFTDWTTVGVFSDKESVIAVQEIQFYTVSFVFLVCFFGITASYFLSYSISRPIGQLTSFMQKAEGGDLSIRYKGERTDEVGRLGRSFNTMLTQINKLITLTELQERQKREAELRSLQAHIKPHFLYNTLDTVHWMARKKGAEDVAEVIESLSRLFRIGLSKGNDIIPFTDEIEHIQSYLKIQETRYQSKLNYSLTISPELQDLFVLKIVLQPIVENAIYHGIRERRGPGHIKIEAKDNSGNLMISVTDDGVGMSQENVESLRERLATALAESEKGGMRKEMTHYGLVNVQQRLKITFGDPYGLYINSEEGKGTTVTIIHPLLHKEP